MASEGTSTISRLDFGDDSSAESRSNTPDTRSRSGSISARSGMRHVDSAEYHSIVSPAAASPFPGPSTSAGPLSVVPAVVSSGPASGLLQGGSHVSAAGPSALHRAASSGGFPRTAAAAVASSGGAAASPPMPGRWPRHTDAAAAPPSPSPSSTLGPQQVRPAVATTARTPPVQVGSLSRHTRPASTTSSPRVVGGGGGGGTESSGSGGGSLMPASPPTISVHSAASDGLGGGHAASSPLSSPHPQRRGPYGSPADGVPRGTLPLLPPPASPADDADAGLRPCYFQPLHTTEPICVATTASAAEWVLLNVGGRLITTTIGTLTADPNSVLASLCACVAPVVEQRDVPSRPRKEAGGAAATATAGAAPTAASATELGGGASSEASPSSLLRNNTHALEGRDGDAQTLSMEGLPGSRSGGGPGAQAGAAAGDDALMPPIPMREDYEDADRGSTPRDGDVRSSPSADPHGYHHHQQQHLAHHRRGAAGDSRSTSPAPPSVSPHPQQQGGAHAHTQTPPPPQSQSMLGRQDYGASSSAAASGGRAAGAVAAAANAQLLGDGEAVSPQHAMSAIPLDTDGANAILLDLDPDYFVPVLNYLRHGAVMIPPYLSVCGVLAMAEYLNVAGLAQLLRGPQMPRRVLLFSWGSGGNGELGTHATRDEPTPTMAQVTPFGVRVREIALGANYSCALSDTGSIYTFGNGEWGQLGLGGSGHVVRGGSGATGPLGGGNGAGSVGTGGGAGGGGGGVGGGTGGGGGGGQDGVDVPVELLIPRRIPLFEQLPAVHVAAGYAFAMAVVTGHHVYFWGNNNHGQSGRGRQHFDLPTKKVEAPVLVETLEGKGIIQLSCGSFFALALSEDGSLYSWGLVDCVGLGTPEEVERRYHDILGESLSNERRAVVLTPQLVTLRGRRRAAAAPATAAAAAERIVRIRAGQWHSGAINEHGELFTWGVGYQGRLGHGSKTPAYVPTLVRGALEGHRVVDVACGSFHTVALTATGAVFCWGDNASGQCGTTAGSPDAFTAPYRVVGLEYVAGGVARSIACGRQHTVVVMEGPQPWCLLPCCRVDAAGFACRSHAQVYSFGEATRAANGGAAAAAAAAAAAVVTGAGRGAAANSHLGVSNSGITGSPAHMSFMMGNAASGYQAALGSGTSAAVAAGTAFRTSLPGTGGHHHPHYQLVPGLHMVDVRGVVSGLHHTFAYVEELGAEEPQLPAAGALLDRWCGAAAATQARGWAPPPGHGAYPLPPPSAAGSVATTTTSMSTAEARMGHAALTAAWRSPGVGGSPGWTRSYLAATPPAQGTPSLYRDPWAEGPIESSTDSLGGHMMPLARSRTMHAVAWNSENTGDGAGRGSGGGGVGGPPTPATASAAHAAFLQPPMQLAGPLPVRERANYFTVSRSGAG